MSHLLNFLPILGQADNGMKTYDVDRMLTQLKKVYAEKAVRSGFEDDSLYNDKLLTLTEGDAKLFQDLNAIVGKTSKQKTPKTITVNDNGLTDEEYEKGEKGKKKKKRDRTPEEQEAIDKIKKAKQQRKTMISILRGVSTKIPLMIYGMDVDIQEDISIEEFVKQVDDKSWKEFMPKGFTKELFHDIAQFYDAEVFVEAGRIIRHRAKELDELDFIERAERIAELFGSFKNPDKETVLTPWRVVNMQIAKGIGGLNFYDDDFHVMTDGGRPNLHWVESEVTKEIYHPDTKIIDINSKTGLYPLHAAMSLYYQAMLANEDKRFIDRQVYQSILMKNIYVIAQTPMAKTITERTLAGYRAYKTNVVYIPALTDVLKQDIDKGKEKVEEAFGHVKFDVVVGNPPYQETIEGTSDRPLYNYFMELSYKIADKVILITPGRFLFNAGKTPKAWNERMLSDDNLKVIFYEQDSARIFPNTDIKGGIVISYRENGSKIGPINTFTIYTELNQILDKVVNPIEFQSIVSIIYLQNRFDLDQVYADYRDLRHVIGSNGKEKRLTTSIFEQIPIFKDERSSEKDIMVLGLIKNVRTYKYIHKRYIEQHENLNKYKIIIPKSNGSGAIGEVLSTPLIGEPLIGYTQSFISFGAYDNALEANNGLKYIKTKFARVLLGTLKITQDNNKDTWRNVPLQDFTSNSDIDWSQSVADIDKQLYKKYGLSESEIAFIEEKVQAME